MDLPDADEWGELYEDDNPSHQWLASVTGFNPVDHDDDDVRRYVLAFHTWVRARDRVDDFDALDEPVHGRKAKLDQLIDYCHAEGRAWVAAAEALDMPWTVQARVLSNGHPTMLLSWDEHDQIEFEADARAGLGMHRLSEKYGLPYSQVRTLTRLFRGPR